MMIPLNIYFATMTGNAEELADTFAAKANELNLEVVTRNLAELKPEDLEGDDLSVFVVSTWGDGEPPDDADEFWAALERSELRLARMNYAIFGLGDSGYPDFNAFARMLDERLDAMGASRLLERFEADIDFDDDFEEWSAKLLEILIRFMDYRIAVSASESSR